MHYLQFSNFIQDIDRRTLHCMRQISYSFDSSTWKKHTLNHTQILEDLRVKREELFGGEGGLKLKGNCPEKNLKSIRAVLEGHQLFNMIR